MSQQDFQEKRDQLDYVEKQLSLLTSEIKEKIRQMREEVEIKVSNALMEEIRRLAILVDEFERPFHPDAMLLTVYKRVCVKLNTSVQITVMYLIYNQHCPK